MPISTRESPVSLPNRSNSLSEDFAEKFPEPAPQAQDEIPGRLTMSPAEIRVIHRLSARANVLPVIARADSLTDDRLAAVKDAVRRGLQDAELDFGVFGPANAHGDTGKLNENGHVNGNGRKADEEYEEESDEDDDDDDDEPEPVRSSRPVVKLRSGRHGSIGRSRSRSRRDLRSLVDLEDSANDEADSIANVRFSAHLVKKTNLSALLPFALIAPEATSTRHRSKGRPLSMESSNKNSMYSSAVEDIATDEGHTVSSQHRSPTFLNGPPEDLRGVFIRKFRWGTVDVLDPAHCDFAVLRTTVLSTHLKVRSIKFDTLAN